MKMAILRNNSSELITREVENGLFFSLRLITEQMPLKTEKQFSGCFHLLFAVTPSLPLRLPFHSTLF